MHFVLLSVICSVVVSVLLKLAPRYGVDVRQAITLNYLVAALLTLGFLQAQPRELLTAPAADLRALWPVCIALAFLLPSIFVVLAVSVRKLGVARTDAAQRLSLLLPLLAAFTLFGEAFNWAKGFGVGVGLLAIVCLLWRPGAGQSATSSGRGAGLWLLAVFVGMGVIDILFKRVAQLHVLSSGTALLLIFTLAFVIALLGMIVLWWRGSARPAWRQLGGGVLLGLFNFGNIWFYIRAHRALPSDPALVFSAMNIGVIALSAVIGLWLFRERLGALNKLGLVLAVVAVVLLASV
ncbi:MAG: EamA/RhaT family transporter [Xanthomonadales bacterium]|nr:EamA/RhaT family transporter [Xanthomonadales bacterium]